MIRQSNDCENYSVYTISFNNGNLTVDYAITPVDSPPECCVVSRSDKPHSDFMQLWRQLTPIAKRFLEFPLKNEDGNDLHIQVVKVKYISSNKYGEGYQLTVHLWNLIHSLVPLRVTTHKFYAEGVDVNHHADGTGLMTQQVLATQVANQGVTASDPVQAAVAAERNRLKELEEADQPNNAVVHRIIKQAKENGQHLSDIQAVLDIIKDEQRGEPGGQQFMQKLVEDQIQSGSNQVGANPGGNITEEQRDAAAADYMVNLLQNKYKGGRA